MFPISAKCCHELARLANVTQCEFIEHFARLLVCTHQLPEEDGVENVDLHAAGGTSEDKGTREQDFAVHCTAPSMTDGS